MGVVFQARDRALDRLVAIKVLTPGLTATAAARRRFAREAKAAAAVVHEHVVTIHAVDATPQGIPYLVMQYIAGRSVQDLLDRGKPPDLRQILRIGMQAASALAAAHAQGLIHRDVKPANILLENGVERVKITDFGLARAIDDDVMTQSGVVAGTPQYMSPEQAQGEPVDHRSDLFSLGSVLYALCTGRGPFQGRSSIATLKCVCEQTPEPIGRLNPEIPAWLVRIIERLHAKNPADRFGSAAEVADLLGRCLAHVQQPATFVLPSDLSPPPRRRKIAAWALVPACVILAALLGVPSVRATAKQAVDYLATVLRLRTPEGVLVIETSDPDIGVKLDGSDLVVTGAGVKELRLAVGPHQVQALKDGKVFRQELVTIRRGGRTVLAVHREPDEQPAAVREVPPTPAARAGSGRTTRSREGTPILSGAFLGQPAINPPLAYPITEYRGLGSEVRWVAFSPDGRILACGMKDGQVEFWDWQAEQAQRHSFLGHLGGVECVAFSPDGKTLASGGWDHHVKLWDLSGGPLAPKLLWDFPGHSDGIRSVAFSPDGTQLVTGGFDRVVTVLESKSGLRIWTSPTLEQPVNGVQFSPDGWMLALALGDYSKGVPGNPVGQPGEVQLWSWLERRRLAKYSGWNRECKSVAFSPDGRLLAATGADGTTHVYDVPSSREKVVLQSGAWTAGVAFRPDGKVLATSNWDGQVLLWDSSRLQLRASVQAHSQNIPCLAFSPDGKALATASADGSVRVWDVSEQDINMIRESQGISPDQEARRLAEVLKRYPPRPSQVEDPLRLFLLDREDGSVTLVADEPDPGSNHVGSPRWSHDGKRILYDAMPGTEYERLRLKMIEAGPDGPKLTDLGLGACPAWSPDDKKIALLINPGVAADARVGIWLMDADGTHRRWACDFGIPLWSPDGRNFLTVSFTEPREVTVSQGLTGPALNFALGGQRIHSWPSWAEADSIVAVIGNEQSWDAVALVGIDRPGWRGIKDVLWERSSALDVKPTWPVYSPATQRCVFVGESAEGMALYEVERGKPGQARRLEHGGLDTRIAGLSLSPGGRYLLFCSTRSAPVATHSLPLQ
jgi:WD40 repeat protein